MNRKIPIQLAAGIILILAIIVSLLIWVGSKQVNKQTTKSPTQKIKSVPKNDTASWKTYRNENLDLTFDYPSSWTLSDADTYLKADDFEIKFNTDNGENIRILGNNDPAKNENVIQPYFGMCAQVSKGLKQFCENEDCIDVNKSTKMIYAAPMMGERVFIAYIYSEISKKYPFLCVETSLNEMSDIITQRDKNGQNQFADKYGGYDIQAYIDNNAINEVMKKHVADLTKFAESIRQ